MKDKLYKLDISRMKAIELAEMYEERKFINNSSLVFNGCIWVFGGSHGVGTLKRVEKYGSERNEWIKMP